MNKGRSIGHFGSMMGSNRDARVTTRFVTNLRMPLQMRGVKTELLVVGVSAVLEWLLLSNLFHLYIRLKDFAHKVRHLQIMLFGSVILLLVLFRF